MDIREVEGLIKQEASVLYRLLRYLNPPMFAFANEIHSVRYALTNWENARLVAGFGWWP
jgi:c-di-GMP-related signal transduction protein